MADFYRSQRDMFPEIDCFAYAPVRRVIALQGADMIATETFPIRAGMAEARRGCHRQSALQALYRQRAYFGVHVRQESH